MLPFPNKAMLLFKFAGKSNTIKGFSKMVKLVTDYTDDVINLLDRKEEGKFGHLYISSVIPLLPKTHASETLLQ